MRELGARLRVEGLDDDQAKALPVQVDGYALAKSEITTWRTDAGNFDVLVNIPSRNGLRLTYEDLADRANHNRDSVRHPSGRPGRHHCFQGVGQPPQGPGRPPELREIAARQRPHAGRPGPTR
jgi:hypothetical protein